MRIPLPKNLMNARFLLLYGTLMVASAKAQQAEISADLAKFTSEGKVPGLVAAAVYNGKIIAAGATGVRKYGDPAAVTVDDRFHLGSCTKSMTGTLAAMLVADGKIKWQTTLGEVFPEMAMHPDFRNATLLQFASNSAGVPHEVPHAIWQKAGNDCDKPEGEARLEFIRALLTSPPAYPPGTQNIYSNGGFTIAGAMLEKVSGKSYAELIRERLFKPLKLDSAGFGAPATQGKIDQPYGHVLREGKVIAILPGPDDDNPPVITPAGRVHLSILDFARYANFHLGTAEHSPLDAAALKFLHTPVPPSDEYALGWRRVKRSWAGGSALTHNGTNTMNYAVMWLAPDKKFAAVAACNIDSGLGASACDAAVSFLIGKFLK
jgi:CubicO group peptidase (beta-lactamase class C family)